jgi:hypothetical protein
MPLLYVLDVLVGEWVDDMMDEQVQLLFKRQSFASGAAMFTFEFLHS